MILQLKGKVHYSRDLGMEKIYKICEAYLINENTEEQKEELTETVIRLAKELERR